MIRVLVASDVRLYREGLADSLRRGGRVEVVGTAADGGATIRCVLDRTPDIVLIDLAMGDWESAVRGVVESAPGTGVVVLGVHEIEDEVVACAEAGVAGYVTREASLEELVEVVESVSRGESLLAPRIGALLLRRVAEAAGRSRAPTGPGRLTPRELQVVGLIDEGLSNKQIAGRLSIELATVKNHVHSILEKLEVERRAEAAARVRQPAS